MSDHIYHIQPTRQAELSLHSIYITYNQTLHKKSCLKFLWPVCLFQFQILVEAIKNFLIKSA